MNSSVPVGGDGDHRDTAQPGRGARGSESPAGRHTVDGGTGCVGEMSPPWSGWAGSHRAGRRLGGWSRKGGWRLQGH